MNARYQPVAVALFVMGVFLLAGFWPLGLVLMAIGAARQASYAQRRQAIRHGVRAKATQRRLEERIIAVRSLR